MSKIEVQALLSPEGRFELDPAEESPDRRRAIYLLLRAVLAGELELRISQGSSGHVVIEALGEQEDQDFLKLAESSFDFWDNPVDDAVWNNA